MPNPREAIYDVLLAKARHRREERRVHGLSKTQEEAFEEWNKQNKKAAAGARRTR